MKFTWNKSERSIEVTELPRRVAGLVSADELTVSVNYTGGSSCRKGITLDNAVMPLMAAAPELLDALRAVVKPLERLGDFIGNADKGGASGLGPFDRCEILLAVRNAIAKAEGRDET